MTILKLQVCHIKCGRRIKRRQKRKIPWSIKETNTKKNIAQMLNDFFSIETSFSGGKLILHLSIFVNISLGIVSLHYSPHSVDFLAIEHVHCPVLPFHCHALHTLPPLPPLPRSLQFISQCTSNLLLCSLVLTSLR